MTALKKEIQDAINHYLEFGSTTRFTPDLILNMQNLWLDHADDENDWRSGEDTYGYDDPKSHMSYISDRWNCAFRLKWILDGLLFNKL